MEMADHGDQYMPGTSLFILLWEDSLSTGTFSGFCLVFVRWLPVCVSVLSTGLCYGESPD